MTAKALQPSLLTNSTTPTTHSPISGNLLSNDPNYTPSSVMANVFALLPPTNGGLTSNVFDQSTSRTTANLWDLKLDQTISNKTSILFWFRLRQY